MAWWATKTRYPPYIDGVVGNKNPLPAPYIDGVVGNKNPLPTLHGLIGGQQKPVTHTTLMAWWATKTRYRPPTLMVWWATKTRYRPPTLMAWWATKTRYPPYIDGVVGNKNPLPTLHKSHQIRLQFSPF